MPIGCRMPGPTIGVVRHIVNDWTLSGITTFMTGFPVTPTCTRRHPASTTRIRLVRAERNRRDAGLRCKQVADPKNFQHDFFNNFNTGAFAMADPGTFGTLGLNTLRQPSYSNWDMTLARRIALGKSETRSIRIRIEAYNVFNHTEFSTIGATYSFSGTTNTKHADRTVHCDL